jgi:hypothetical protein
VVCSLSGAAHSPQDARSQIDKGETRPDQRSSFLRTRLAGRRTRRTQPDCDMIPPRYGVDMWHPRTTAYAIAFSILVKL